MFFVKTKKSDGFITKDGEEVGRSWWWLRARFERQQLKEAYPSLHECEEQGIHLFLIHGSELEPLILFLEF
ncbi:hypothetical protein H70737_17185 [Paenibacillus sp. FSL H7-0737]|nr:hypothetical protein H70737_17185 [Paenibacillus sp. FSL H7-0737]